MRKNFIHGIIILFTALLGLSLASSYIDPNTINLSLFGLLFPYILLPVLAVLPFTFRIWKAGFYILTLLFILGCTYLPYYVQVKRVENVRAVDGFTIMTYNAMIGARLINNRREVIEERKNQFLSLINDLPTADIFCGQELGLTARDILAANTQFNFKHTLPRRSAVIYSRFPIVRKGEVDFGPKINSCLWADLDVGGDTVRLYSVHLESNKLRQSSFELLTEESSDNSEAVTGFLDIASKYFRFARTRAQQAHKIRDHADNCPYPVIIAGDFNEAPISHTYRILKKNIHDAFLQNGVGIGSTWNGGIPLLRIDYILHSRDIKNVDFALLKSNLSDHYPIKAVFTLK